MKKLAPLDFSRGINLLRDIRYVGEGELTYAKNFVPTKSGMAGKRLGRGLMNGASGLPVAIGWQSPLSLYVTDVPNADFLMVGRSITATSTIAGVQVFNYAGGGALVGANYTSVPARRPQGVNFNKKLYLVSGPGAYLSLTSGLATSGVILQLSTLNTLELAPLTFSTAQSLAVEPRLLAAYRQRMVYADFGAGKEDWLIFSDRQDPTAISAEVLAANGRNFRLGGTPGRCTAIREALLTSTGTPTETVLLAFKERAMYIIQGEPGLTFATTPGPGSPATHVEGSLSVQRVNTDAGCSSPETIVNTPYGLLWAGPDDVWFMREGSVPMRVGSNIRPALEATPADKRYLWHASYFNGFYRLSVFADGQGPTDDSPCGEQYWLDLRDGLEKGPRWWGPMVYKSVPGLAVPTWTANTAYVLGNYVNNGGQIYVCAVGGTSAGSGGPTGTGAGIIDNTVTWNWHGPYLELTGSRMQALDTRDGRQATLISLEFNWTEQSYLHSYDVPPSGRDGDALGGFTGSIFPWHLDDTEIDVELRTAELDDGDPGTEKTYQGTEVLLATSETVQLAVETQFDGGARVTTDEEAIISSSQFVLDASVLDTGLLTREFRAHTIHPNEGTRPYGRTLRQRIYDRPGYVIDETNNILHFLVQIAPVNVRFFTITLTSGFYSDISSLLTSVCAQMSAATTGTAHQSTFTHNQGPPRGSVNVTLTCTLAAGVLEGWGIIWATDLTFTALDPLKAKFGAQLGFNVVADPTTSDPYIAVTLTPNLTAPSAIYNKRSAHFELNNIIHDLRPFGRRPL